MNQASRRFALALQLESNPFIETILIAVWPFFCKPTLDEKRILPCSAHIDGEYGIRDIYTGVPVILGRKGVEKIIELSITAEEAEALKQSAESVRKDVQLLTDHKFL